MSADTSMMLANECMPIAGKLNVEAVSPKITEKGEYTLFIVSLPDEIKGELKLNEGIGAFDGDNCCCLRKVDTEDGEEIELHLTPKLSGNGRECELSLTSPLEDCEYVLHIPEGFFSIWPNGYEEVGVVDISVDDLENLRVGGAWHKKGEPWNCPGLFSFHDDDGIDGQIKASVPGDYRHGYFSLLYPLLESLGLRGCISLEGRRIGLTSEPPRPNENFNIARRLQDECGWEIMNHSMVCLGERLNNWVVDSLDTPVADRILAENDYYGSGNSRNTTVYSRQTRLQYEPAEDRCHWIESEPHAVKPFAADIMSKRPVIYNDAYDADYHWGEWFSLADDLGIHS